MIQLKMSYPIQTIYYKINKTFNNKFVEDKQDIEHLNNDLQQQIKFYIHQFNKDIESGESPTYTIKLIIFIYYYERSSCK